MFKNLSEDEINFEQEIENIRKSGASIASENSNPQPVAPVKNNSQPEPEIIKKGRGRPKGSKNKVNIDSSSSVTPSTSAPSSNNISADNNQPVYQRVTPAMATGFVGLLNGMFIVFKIPEITDDEKKGFVEVWSNVELPFDPNSQLMKYLPLISAGIFTIALVLPRLSAMKKRNADKAKLDKEKVDLHTKPKPDIIIEQAKSTSDKANLGTDSEITVMAGNEKPFEGSAIPGIANTLENH